MVYNNLCVCVPASEMGLVTQGLDAGNAENLSTLIISGNCVSFSVFFLLIRTKLLLKSLTCFAG